MLHRPVEVAAKSGHKFLENYGLSNYLQVQCRAEALYKGDCPGAKRCPGVKSWNRYRKDAGLAPVKAAILMRERGKANGYNTFDSKS